MILHVACLPFPSFQGTQAAIGAMLEASVNTGRPTHLLTYAQEGYELDATYEIHRIPDLPKVRSLRSGPSWGKLALDARCVLETRRLARRLQVKAIVAHHIEAALAALAAGVAPVYYVAHTSLAQELPAYFPTLAGGIVGPVGARFERLVRKRAAGVAAVAPSLARILGHGASYLPVPWSAEVLAPPSRAESRSALGLADGAEVCLYAGNLDPYQGWERLIDALVVLRRSHPNVRLLLATESDPAPAWQQAQKRGVSDSLSVCRLDGERARAQAHAASDLSWIPRRTEGGLPIKMLDAFARSLPVVAMERATADMRLRAACIRVRNDDAEALAVGALRVLEDPDTQAALRDAGRSYLANEHSSKAFDSAMRRLLGENDGFSAHRDHALSTYAPTRAFLDPS
jgi:glycosyltransferase involved in cell wall biosynthesis